MNPWLKRYISVPQLAVLGCMAYVLFFNENSVKHNMELSKDKRELEARIAMYEDTLQLYTQLLHRLDTDPSELERILREQYHYQRLSEDVFLLNP